MSVMLTTVDNPFDPFTQFDEWFAYDEQQNYHTCSLLDRISKTSYYLTDQEQAAAIEQAMDDIIKTFGLGLYKKVHRTTEQLADDTAKDKKD